MIDPKAPPGKMRPYTGGAEPRTMGGQPVMTVTSAPSPSPTAPTTGGIEPRPPASATPAWSAEKRARMLAKGKIDEAGNRVPGGAAPAKPAVNRQGHMEGYNAWRSSLPNNASVSGQNATWDANGVGFSSSYKSPMADNAVITPRPRKAKPTPAPVTGGLEPRPPTTGGTEGRPPAETQAFRKGGKVKSTKPAAQRRDYKKAGL